MTKRKFTPPTEFPAYYVDGFGNKVTIYARGHGEEPLLGQYDDGGMASFDLTGSVGFSDRDCDLHDIPKRTSTWHNVYEDTCISLGYSSREIADKYALDNRVCVYRIALDPDYNNPVLFVEGV